jgi:hypothetical protein
VGRLSFDRHGGARAGADGAVSSRRSERRGPGSGDVGAGGTAVRHLTAGSRTAGANPLPCSRSLYDMCSDSVSSSRFHRAGQGAIRSAIRENDPDTVTLRGGDLGKCSRSGRPILVGVFHEFFGALETAECSMPSECATGHFRQGSALGADAGRYRSFRLGIIPPDS